MYMCCLCAFLISLPMPGQQKMCDDFAFGDFVSLITTKRKEWPKKCRESVWNTFLAFVIIVVAVVVTVAFVHLYRILFVNAYHIGCRLLSTIYDLNSENYRKSYTQHAKKYSANVCIYMYVQMFTMYIRFVYVSSTTTTKKGAWWRGGDTTIEILFIYSQKMGFVMCLYV